MNPLKPILLPFSIQPIVLVLAFLLFSATSGLTQAQCTKRLSELPAAPELLGFRLGMSKEDVKVRVPQTAFGRADDFGVAKTTINPYFDPRIDKTKLEGVRTISLDLLDDRVTSIWIGFDETFKVQSVGDFVKLISQSLQVPEQWSSWKSRGQQLRCGDFQLIVTIVARGPSLRILDVAAEDTIAARRQAQEERESALEAESAEAETTEVIGDKHAKVYYSDGCQGAKEIKEANRITFKSAGEAEQAGFKLAKNCP
jgi:hypothetical protein